MWEGTENKSSEDTPSTVELSEDDSNAVLAPHALSNELFATTSYDDDGKRDQDGRATEDAPKVEDVVKADEAPKKSQKKTRRRKASKQAKPSGDESSQAVPVAKQKK